MAAGPRLVAFGEEPRLRAALRVATCAGYTVQVEADPGRLLPALDAPEAPAITRLLFDLNHAGPAASELLRAARLAAPGATVLHLAQPSPSSNLTALLDEPGFAHLLGLGGPHFMTELAATLAQLDGRPAHGLRPYLPWGTRLVERKLSGSAEKGPALDALAEYLDRLGIRGRLCTRVQSVADELIMNAVYDAPRDPTTGEYPFAARARSEAVHLPDNWRPTLSYGSDGATFGLAVTDPFGGLNGETVTRYVAKGLRRGVDQIDRKAGGAGLGLFLMFDHLNSLIVQTTPNQRTTVAGLLDIRGSLREVASAPKSLNCFTHPNQG